MNAAEIHDILFVNDRIFVATWGSGAFFSDDNGRHWVQSNTGMTRWDLLCMLRSGPALLIGSAYDGVFRSIDNGQTWSLVNTGLRHLLVTSLTTDGNLVFAATFFGVHASTNHGQSWIGLTQFTDKVIWAVNYDGSLLYAATDGDGIFRSSDQGLTWTEVNDGLTSLYVYAILKADGAMYAGTDEGVFVTLDGEHWIPVRNGMENETVLSLAHDGNTLYAGTYDHGVWRSVDGGTSWSQWNDGLSSQIVWALKVDGNSIFAGTAGNGVYQRPVENIIVPVTTAQKNNAPLQIELRQNYPNPFNPTTTVYFDLPQRSRVRLAVFNARGQLVRTLAQGSFENGSHSVFWDGRNETGHTVASGAYFYRLETDDFIRTRKMLLIK